MDPTMTPDGDIPRWMVRDMMETTKHVDYQRSGEQRRCYHVQVDHAA